MRILSLLTILSLCSCSLVTVPLKVVGKAATTTIDVAGSAVKKGLESDTEEDRSNEEEPAAQPNYAEQQSQYPYQEP